jgi:hypothetical protein
MFTPSLTSLRTPATTPTHDGGLQFIYPDSSFVQVYQLQSVLHRTSCECLLLTQRVGNSKIAGGVAFVVIGRTPPSSSADKVAFLDELSDSLHSLVMPL